jgi:hypothetical protein
MTKMQARRSEWMNVVAEKQRLPMMGELGLFLL